MTKKGFTKTRHSDEQSEEESNKLDRSFAVAQDDEVRQGFTLVELSIVLVIIGLLISGLLVGQSMIKVAKNQALIKQLQQYDILFRNFKEAYRYLPGDLPNATAYFGTVGGSCMTDAGTGTQSCDGNGDGNLGYDSGHEPIRSWEHLQNADMLNTDYTGAAYGLYSGTHALYTAGVTAPSSEHDSSSVISILYMLSSYTWAGTTTRHTYSIGDPQNTNNPGWVGRWHGMGFTPQEALALDVKLDDGMPFQGEVVHMNGSGYSSTCTGNVYTSVATYDTSYSDKACIMMVDADFDN